MNPFTKDKTIWIKGVEMRVVRQLEGSDVQLENTKSGELVTQKLFNLLQQYASGELLTAGQRRHQLRTGEKSPRGQRAWITSRLPQKPKPEEGWTT